LPKLEENVMNHRAIIAASAIAALGLGLLPGSAFSQQKSLKDQLVGAWTVVSYDRTLADGTKQSVANPKGLLIFESSGRYVVAAERGDRPKFKSAGQATTEELAAATADFFAANFGTWSVGATDKILVQHFDGALRPNNEGSDAKYSISLTGDELKLTQMMPLATGVRTEQTYRRAK
jgi:hypothetical protein